MNECMHRLFQALDPIGQKMRFHLRAGTSFTGTVHELHFDAAGRIAVIQLVPGHKSTGDYMFLNGEDICAIAYVENAASTTRSRDKLEVVAG